MKVRSPRAVKRARIEIIPLIDIIFFLLATFVMVSLSMVKDQGIAVRLPEAASGKEQGKQAEDYAAISITKDGQVFLNKEKIEFLELGARLQEMKSRMADPQVVVNGDEASDLGLAVKVMDEVRKAGIEKVAIRTRQGG